MNMQQKTKKNRRVDAARLSAGTTLIELSVWETSVVYKRRLKISKHQQFTANNQLPKSTLRPAPYQLNQAQKCVDSL